MECARRFYLTQFFHATCTFVSLRSHPHQAFKHKGFHILHPRSNKKLKQILYRILIPVLFVFTLSFDFCSFL